MLIGCIHILHIHIDRGACCRLELVAHFQHDHRVPNLRLNVKTLPGLGALHFLCSEHLLYEVKQVGIPVEIRSNRTKAMTDMGVFAAHLTILLSPSF